MGTETAQEGLVFPFVHLNGTGRDELYRQREAVWDALEAVWDALREMSPNVRDYYPYPDGPKKLAAAVQQHRDRQGVVQELYDELEAEMDHILNV